MPRPILNYTQYAEIAAEQDLAVIDEKEFKALSVYASRLLDSYTFGVSADTDLLADYGLVDVVQEACALQIAFQHGIGLDEVEGTSQNGAQIASESESFGGSYSHSVTYRDTPAGRPVVVHGKRIAPDAVMLLAPVVALGRQLGKSSRRIQ